MSSIQKAQQVGQSIWFDNIDRALIKSGELGKLVESGITGLTANPTILEKAITGSADYDDEIRSLAKHGKTNPEIYETMAIEDIRHAADLMRKVWEDTEGADGYACLEITPLVAYDLESTIVESRRLFSALDRPNVMVKVPATEEGIPAIRLLTAEGMNVNVTLIFSLEMYDKVKEAYIAGLEDLVEAGGDPGTVASVASFFLSRIDTAVDNELQDCLKRGNNECKGLLGMAAISSAKVAYRRFKDTFYGARFEPLLKLGARCQRLLWASTGTKNPAYSDLKYVESIIGAETVNTVPPATLKAFLDHGKVAATVEKDIEESAEALMSLSRNGISLREITDKLLTDGVKSFTDSYVKLLASIEDKKGRLAAAGSHK